MIHLTSAATCFITLASQATEHAESASSVLDLIQPHPIVFVLVDIGIVIMILCMALTLFRLVRGPHLADRALALDTMAIMIIGLVILLTIRLRTPWFLDGVLALSLLSFAGSVAIAQYIARLSIKRRKAGPEHGPEHSPTHEALETSTPPNDTNALPGASS